MHARLSYQQQHQQPTYVPRGPSEPRSVPLQATKTRSARKRVVVAVESDANMVGMLRDAHWGRRGQWRCERIEEEEGPSAGTAAAVEPLSAVFGSELYKRHHRPRPAQLLLLSTTTTSPVHINHTHDRDMANLLPRADSFNARTRGSSHIDFKTATTGVAAKAMRNELSRLVGTVQDSKQKKVSPHRSTPRSRRSSPSPLC